MALPRGRTTSTSRNKRRSHMALSKKGINKCSACGKTMLGHRACPHCGAYKGKETILSRRVARKKKRSRIKSV